MLLHCTHFHIKINYFCRRDRGTGLISIDYFSMEVGNLQQYFAGIREQLCIPIKKEETFGEGEEKKSICSVTKTIC